METAKPDIVNDGDLPPQHECFEDWNPIRGLIECNHLALWHGPCVGKSAFALLAAAQLLTGRDDLTGLPTLEAHDPKDRREHRILYLSLADSLNVTTLRFAALRSYYKLDGEILDRIRMAVEVPVAAWEDVDKRIECLDRAIRQVKATVVFIDPFVLFSPETVDETRRGRRAPGNLLRVARDNECAIVALDGQPGLLGLSASNSVRFRGYQPGWFQLESRSRNSGGLRRRSYRLDTATVSDSSIVVVVNGDNPGPSLRQCR